MLVLSHRFVFSLFCFYFTDPTKATDSGENVTVAGGVQMFTCPVEGNPEPNIVWFNEKQEERYALEDSWKQQKMGATLALQATLLNHQSLSHSA